MYFLITYSTLLNQKNQKGEINKQANKQDGLVKEREVEGGVKRFGFFGMGWREIDR